MITVIYCTRKPNPEHTKHIIQTSGLDKHIQVIEIINNGESLTKAYNRGLTAATNDIVVFMHDDLAIETKQWGHKLLKQFKANPEFGIIGVAGTKHLAASGKWWEDRKKMYGRVAHTHEGKTWLSSYSRDLGNTLEDVVVVDGVFFAIDKTKATLPFNESVEGFHFYDATFCFENYLNGTVIGVTTAVRVNHNSIGMTNDQWEVNRQIFAETFKDNLPVTIKRILRKDEKLKVLIACLNFNHYTGSELYVYELAKSLVKQGCDVSISSTLGAPLSDAMKKFGVKLYTLQEPPTFKLGDGKWSLKGANGDVLSQPQTLYKISDAFFDVIHLNHKPVTEHMLRFFPDTPVVCSIHSEVIALEEPVISPQIKKYIAIRPEIKDYIVDRFGIDESMVDVIYNPIDTERFNNKPLPNMKIRTKKRIIFIGTIDYLRKDTIQDLIDTTKTNGEDLWIVGKKNDDYLDMMISGQDHVQYFEPTFNVEKYIKDCDETAGILLGRTTIEGWLCGKSGWIYDVDKSGKILSKTLHGVPSDVAKFGSDVVGAQIMEEYKKIL